MKAWKKVLKVRENPTKQQCKEAIEIILMFGFLLLAAFVRIIKVVFWECKDRVGNLFARVFKKKKES